MKVMCINEGWKLAATNEESKGPKYGEICTVSHEKTFHTYHTYCIQEHRMEYYLSSSFIPLSDIDETELVNQRETKEPCKQPQ